MNDLAEKALHGLDAARREVCARPMSSFAALGLALSSVVMVFGARVGAARPARPLTTWFGLEETHGAGPSDPVPAAIMLAALVALLLTWIAVVELVHRTRQPARRVWWVAAAWAAPFAVGPPLMDTTAYSYAAFGLLQRNGHSPYASGPNRLGDVPVVSAIVPGARGAPSGSGPLGTLVQHLAVSVGAGSALAAVIILRLLAVFVAIAIGRLAADLAGRRRARALSLVVLNPLVLLYVVSAVHLDGLLVMFVLAAALAAGRRRWVAAVVFAALAGCVSGQGFVALLVVVAAHLLGRRGRPVWRLLGQDALAGGVPIGVIGIAASNGFGWLHTITKQFTADTPFSVAGATAKLLGPIVRGASHDDLVDGARITALIAMVCVLGYLTATVRQRGLARTLGYAFLAVALLAPVLYPWYLLWGTLCLAPSAAGARRVAVLALCTMACLLNPPGFAATTTNVLTGVALVVVAAAAAAVLSPQQRDEVPAQELISRTAGRTSAR